MGNIIDMPCCPNCSTEMKIEFGDTEFSDDGVIHNFTCQNCNTKESWTGKELKEKGIGRPSLQQFINYFNIRFKDVKTFFSTKEIALFIIQRANNPSAISNENTFLENVQKMGIGIHDVSNYFERETIKEFTEHMEEKKQY